MISNVEEIDEVVLHLHLLYCLMLYYIKAYPKGKILNLEIEKHFNKKYSNHLNLFGTQKSQKTPHFANHSSKTHQSRSLYCYDLESNKKLPSL